MCKNQLLCAAKLRIWDIAFVILLFFLGGLVSILFYEARSYTFFYQFFIPESILWGCGYEFLLPKQFNNEFIAFVDGKELTFDCNKIHDPVMHNSAGVYAKIQPYLAWTAAILWRLFGVDYKSLSPLIFFLWGSYISGSYLLFRQFNNKIWSILATFFILFSPVTVHMIGDLRDFSKAPFIIWTLAFLIISVKLDISKNRQSFLFAAFAGATVGLGLGFRSDLILFIPLGSLFLLIGTIARSEIGLMQKITYKLKYLIVFFTAFLLFSFPIINRDAPSGLFGVFAMQGMTEPFSKALKLDPAAYSNGWAYSDELTLSTIAARERAVDPDWDQRERSGIPGLTSSQTFNLGNHHFLNSASVFTADIATQALESFSWMIGFPLYIANSGYLLNISFPYPTPHSIIYEFYKSLNNPALLIIFMLGFISLLFDSYLNSRRYFFAIALLFISIAALPAVQFNFRHFFYLEFLSILCVISVLHLPFRIYRNLIKFRNFSFWVISISVMYTASYLALAHYQKLQLESQISDLLNSPRLKVQLRFERSIEGYTFYKVPVPPQFSKLVKSDDDSMTPTMRFKGVQWDVRSAATWYLLTSNSVECLSKTIGILVKYHHTATTWQPLDTNLVMTPRESVNSSGLLFPGFYRPTQYFATIGVPDEFKNCNFELNIIEGMNRIPFSFTANIESGKLSGPSNKGIGVFLN